MADDIVTRLRERQRELEFRWPDDDPPKTWVGEATDEIERLRTLIDAVKDYLHRNSSYSIDDGQDEDNNWPIIEMETWFDKLLKESDHGWYIVPRLQDTAYETDLCWEAADEIEVLQTALALACGLLSTYYGMRPPDELMQQFMEEARRG